MLVQRTDIISAGIVRRGVAEKNNVENDPANPGIRSRSGVHPFRIDGARSGARQAQSTCLQ